MTLLIVAVTFVFAFAGVKPFSDYKNNIFERISSSISKLNSQDFPVTEDKYTQKSTSISLSPTPLLRSHR